ncbi:IMP dehydrogenase [Aeropyrum camini]|uniref:Inosine-5'-monophosphate dehydrogenase n=1 Tax=Aeropyrum camini SY1 = JCM 12091 TaxID=1198449 RepID=U3TDB3_9CREN|nr:IMP dehydrogenase [Aeropyrum camini]BAN90416.1 inosine-5'-monophosphate dehydrogenase [Aeropyrum camini SY1 = JCM 12091]
MEENSYHGIDTLLLTFDDVAILPGLSTVEPHDVDLATKVSKRIFVSTPFVSSPMDTVTEWRMAAALARLGAVGVIHRNMPREEQARQVRIVKGLSPSPWSEVPRIKLPDGLDNYSLIMEEVEAGAAVVFGAGGIKGYLVLERPDAQFWLDKARYLSLYLLRIRPLPTIDGDGRLIVGAAVSPFDIERARLLEKSGADFLVVDVAHLHNTNALSSLARLVKEVSIDVVAGNLGTKEGVLDTLSRAEEVAGLRMGISSGSICSTGEVAGAAVPTLTAVMNAAQALEELGLAGRIPIIADGGVRNAGDAAKAIIAGASAVMGGRIFAGAEESPGPRIRVGDRLYKPYRGMASRGAMERRFAVDRYSRQAKAVEEGVEGLVPYTGPVVKTLYELAEGLKAALGYAGAQDIISAWRARLARVTPSGSREIKPHDILL